MKKFLAILATMVLTLVSIFSLVGCVKDEKTLYVYTNAGFPPYEYVNESGEVCGVDVDIMNKIGEELGYNVIINDVAFNTILTEVEKNEYAVGAAGMTKKPDRDAIALASNVYATSYQYVIAPAGSLDSVLVNGKVPVTALSGKKIAVQEGTTGNFLIEDAINGFEDEDTKQHVKGEIEGTNASCVLYRNAIIASNDIGTQADVVIIDKLPAEAIANGNTKLQAYALDAEPESYVLYFNKNATELVEKVNEVLDKLTKDGTIAQYTLNHSGN